MLSIKFTLDRSLYWEFYFTTSNQLVKGLFKTHFTGFSCFHPVRALQRIDFGLLCLVISLLVICFFSEISSVFHSGLDYTARHMIVKGK